ncbi:unnamed protein product [Cuscuta epithymum]|uniref:Uncharacterized protein n=1 Tax=Cuscuta epithymum TaxID=186058 RepID=A0AAV0G8B3_9ASTE|nr:unnamed protein product [Cuscuta epithymum]CAH9144003.1 unnamed protein product [Cuscuta epithymum]
MAARIIAQLIVMGSGIMARAFVQAYRQALANASKTGAAQEVAQNIRRGSKIMTETEARQILGVTEKSTWEEVLQFAARDSNCDLSNGYSHRTAPVITGKTALTG